MPDRKTYLKKAKRVVVKIGSSLLTGEKGNRIQTAFLSGIARQIRALQDRGLECLIVTSGAIAAGLFKLGYTKRPKEMAELQALASVGQSHLMGVYAQTFKKYSLTVSQILLTREDLSHRHRYSNAYKTMEQLFRHKIVPIVNENDTVAVEEIKVGDNDTLGMLVTHLCQADLLILLTDTDGFFEEDPRVNPKAKLISDVETLDKAFLEKATRSQSMVGTGGMKTKVQAAQNMMKAGVPMVIANGRAKNVLQKVMAGEKIGTFFHPAVARMNSRNRWLAWSGHPKGRIVVDAGAVAALLEKDKSLLPSGILRVEGRWEKGDIVRIVDAQEQEVAKGFSNYSSAELDEVKGMKTDVVSAKLGRLDQLEAVHRNNLVKTR